jgi:hypothetical protein
VSKQIEAFLPNFGDMKGFVASSSLQLHASATIMTIPKLHSPRTYLEKQ